LWAKGRPGIEPEDIFQVSSDSDSDDEEAGPLAADDSFEKDPTWVLPFRNNVNVETKGAPVKRSQRLIRKDGGTMEIEQGIDESFLPETSDGDRSMDSNTTTTGNARKRITNLPIFIFTVNEGPFIRRSARKGNGIGNGYIRGFFFSSTSTRFPLQHQQSPC